MKNAYVNAENFFETIDPEDRVFFLVRHAEREHIRANDPNHGAFVELTDRGREQAFALGQTIARTLNFAEFHRDAAGEKGVAHDIFPDVFENLALFSSPVGRCVQTAEYIGYGFISDKFFENNHSVEGSPVVTPLQPLADFFVEHYDAYMATHTTGFYQGICRWLDGTANNLGYVDPAYFPLASRSEEMIRLMLDNGHARINIFCSHDAWIVPCLAHFCGLKFSPQLWMNFLTGMAVVVPADCSLKEIMRIARFVPVTGASDGNMYF